MLLSVLDQSLIVSGSTAHAAITNTVTLARQCEALGYHRFWLSEHHSATTMAGTAPEILLGALTQATSKIRLGAAGIMLPHYSAFKIAEQFRVLEALAPGRIDLGVGRAPGGDMRTAFALNPQANDAAKYFPAQIRDLIAWVSNTALPENHPFHGVTAYPLGPTNPQFWVLGSSDYGAQLAAHFGLPYAFAYFFNDGEGAAQALRLYHESFRPSQHLTHPYCAIAVSAFAADTPEEAENFQLARDVWRAERERGRFIHWPSPSEAAAYSFTPHEDQRRLFLRSRSIAGTASHVMQRLNELLESLKIQEIALVSPNHDETLRRRSFALIAKAAQLQG